MLYNPQWTQPDVFSLESLIAWLEQQPPKKRYSYMNVEGRCLIGQYLTAHGLAWGHGYYSDVMPNENFEHNGLMYSCRGYIAAGFRGDAQTFGAALKRARAVLEKRRSAQ